MQNDHNTIEQKNYVTGIAGQLTKYGFTTVRTSNIEKFLSDLHETFCIKAYVEQDGKGRLPEGVYFIRETK